MKLGEFIAHSHLFGRVKAEPGSKRASRACNEGTLEGSRQEQPAAGTKGVIKKAVLDKNVDALSETEFKDLFVAMQNLKLMAPVDEIGALDRRRMRWPRASVAWARSTFSRS